MSNRHALLIGWLVLAVAASGKGCNTADPGTNGTPKKSTNIEKPARRAGVIEPEKSVPEFELSSISSLTREKAVEPPPTPPPSEALPPKTKATPEEETDAESESAEEHFAEGEKHGIRRQYEKAIASYDKALEVKPDFAKALLYKGYALHNLGRNTEAITAFEEAVELGDESAKGALEVLLDAGY